MSAMLASSQLHRLQVMIIYDLLDYFSHKLDQHNIHVYDEQVHHIPHLIMVYFFERLVDIV